MNKIWSWKTVAVMLACVDMMLALHGCLPEHGAKADLAPDLRYQLAPDGRECVVALQAGEVRGLSCKW